ncbi:MAG: tetratricopeptide repeat protein [Armatimonadota bacterium]
MGSASYAAALVLAASLFGTVAGAAPDGAPPHLVTSSSESGQRDYQSGLRDLHAGRLDSAIARFTSVVQRDPACVMARWGLSRALDRAGPSGEALAMANTAAGMTAGLDDREQRLIKGWQQLLSARSKQGPDRNRETQNAQRDLDYTLALYPDDPEIWLLRAEAEPNAIRATPFILTALRIDTSHPIRGTWKLQVPPAPDVKPTAPTQPVAELAQRPRLFEGLGKLSHPITTKHPLAQQYYEQGLRCMHSYVMPGHLKEGAAACFQAAANLDPTCAMAYWGLSFCSTAAMKQVDAANRALELALQHGTDKERRYAAIRVLELSGNAKREETFDAIAGAIAAYPDDVELWIWRGKIYGAYGNASGNVSYMPYQLAALKIQPDHPSPNHELVHLYEAIDRPALGWPYSVGYRESAPNMPHANHMQAHLAMRIGRWQDAIDATRMSRKRSLEGYPELDPGHHIDILVRALAHEGRFREAEAEPRAYRGGLPWARLLQLKGITSELEEWAEQRIGRDAPDGFYIGAIVRLDQNDLPNAAQLVAKVEEQWKKNQEAYLYRYHEVKGRYLVQSGEVEEGLKLLREAGAKAVKDSGLHAWGGGSYVLEAWGTEALRAHRWDEAEEAFHEALAHEHGSILGALGMQVVWEQRGDAAMARHYATRAAQIWKDADPGSLDRQLERLRKTASSSAVAAAARRGGK